MSYRKASASSRIFRPARACGVAVSALMGLAVCLVALLVVPAGLTGPASSAHAQETGSAAPSAAKFGRVTGFPIPRFVSLKSGEVNMRRGPGADYPIDWVYQRRGLPVEVIDEFDNWRRVRAHDGTQGWVHYQLLDGRRMGLVKGGKVELYRRQEKSEGGLTAIISPGVILRLQKCGPVWCRAEVSGYKGWVGRDFLWGVYPGEVFD